MHVRPYVRIRLQLGQSQGRPITLRGPAGVSSVGAESERVWRSRAKSSRSQAEVAAPTTERGSGRRKKSAGLGAGDSGRDSGPGLLVRRADGDPPGYQQDIQAYLYVCVWVSRVKTWKMLVGQPWRPERRNVFLPRATGASPPTLSCLKADKRRRFQPYVVKIGQAIAIRYSTRHYTEEGRGRRLD